MIEIRRRGVCAHTKQKHLDLISLQKLVALELIFDFFISDLPLLVFRAHSTTHRDGDPLCRRNPYQGKGVCSSFEANRRCCVHKCISISYAEPRIKATEPCAGKDYTRRCGEPTRPDGWLHDERLRKVVQRRDLLGCAARFLLQQRGETAFGCKARIWSPVLAQRAARKSNREPRHGKALNLTLRRRGAAESSRLCNCSAGGQRKMLPGGWKCSES